MALACPRCATQNPEGNAFCQACGTPLSAPVAVTAAGFAGSPAGGMAPPPPPPGYQTPYYAPTGAPVAVHRTTWVLIIAVVLVATVITAGIGTALAFLGNRAAQTATTTSIADIPGPSQGGTPSPVASPTSTAQTGLESNDAFSLNVPSGWAIDSKDNESMVLSDPNGEGSVTVSSGESFPTQSAQNNKDTVDSTLKAKYPDTRECPNTSPANGTLNGVAGISWTLCFTLTGAANSAPAAATVFAGANSSGTVYYLVMVLTTESNLNAYVNASKPVLSSVRWKLS